jgi:hypothetical protein
MVGLTACGKTKLVIMRKAVLPSMKAHKSRAVGLGVFIAAIIIVGSYLGCANNPKFDGVPSWSPDGNRIAFISNKDGNVEIYVMNADGTE